MSFCRPLLFPVHTSPFLRQQLVKRYGLTFYDATLRNATAARPFPFLGGNTFATTSPPVLPSSLYIPKPTFSKAYKQKKDERRAALEENCVVKHPTASEFAEMHAHDPEHLVALLSTSHLDKFWKAVESNTPELAEAVVLDVLDSYQGSQGARNHLLDAMLTKDVTSLKRETILRVLQCMEEESDSRVRALLMRNNGYVARRMLDNPDICDTDRPFLRIFHPMLLVRLPNVRSPRIVKTTDFEPPFLIYGAFSAIHKLLDMGFEKQALEIFQLLVTSGYVPVEALHNVDNTSDDAALIIYMAVIRSCLHWNWRALAAVFMSKLLTTRTPTKPIIDLNTETIHALLNTHPTQRDISACGHLIRRAHWNSPVPNNVIRSFYNCAHLAEAGKEAELLYSFTRSKRILEVHRYPPPMDLALPWLMDHLTTVGQRTHLARTLATETVQDELFLPTSYRAQFIAKVARKGYATQARALWERYSVGKDGELIAADAALMVRMVSLFWKLHKSHLQKAADLRAAEGESVDEEELKRLETISNESGAFAESVRLAFAFHYAPLPKAHHWHLTSLARACFIVGRISEGFQTLRYLLQRQEVPDLYDTNVALSAVAQLSPRLAATMIGRMVKLGLRPDGVSFATALHYAVVQGEREIVDTMIKHIRSLGDRRISLKTLSSIIRASIAAAKQGTPQEASKSLDNILHLVKSFPHINLASETALAKALVYAALQAKDGVAAYNFWKLLLRVAAPWDDTEQQRLRHSIAWHIRAPSFPLRKERARMLATLGQKQIRM
ncbi:hypothetical protein H0H92_009628 [Tricholoma furcatifolium]|nr:hypothetical protein H0H92_009628 [Tricholoma furcatifolium]